MIKYILSRLLFFKFNKRKGTLALEDFNYYLNGIEKKRNRAFSYEEHRILNYLFINHKDEEIEYLISKFME